MADLPAKELVLSHSELTVTEGGSGSYKVKLATQPSGDVTVTIGGTSGTDVIVDNDGVEPGNQYRLTFTTATWNSEQAVMVTAGEDSDSANDSVTLSHTAAGGGYDRVSGSVGVTVTDDDPPALVLSHSELRVSEGGSGSYTVKLATQPSGDVTVTVGGTSGTDVIVDTDGVEPGNQDRLTFTTATWNSEQAVIVTAAEDSDSANDSVTISHTAAGGGYDRVRGTIGVTVTDDDPTALVLSRSALTVTEGGSGSYKVKLATQPSGEVTVTVGGTYGTDVIVDSNGGEVGNQDRLTFTPATWDSEQAVIVTAAEDSDSANDSVTISHTAAGGGYDKVSSTMVVTVTDDDPPALVLSRAALTVTEGGSGSYKVTLATQPSGDVTVTIGGTSGTDVIVDSNSGELGNQDQLTFTTATWNHGQAVMVTAAEDSDSANDSVTLSHTAAGGGYDKVSGTMVVTVTDDDPPALALSRSELMLNEGGSGSYKVTLATQPSGDVTVTVGGTSGTDVIVDTDGGEPGNQNQLTFTTATWNSGQAVIVTAAEDSDSANDSVTLSHVAAGGGYNGVSSNIVVTVTDDDTGTKELVLSRSELTVNEGGSGSYTVKLATQPSGDVTVTVGGTSGTDVIVDTDGGRRGNQKKLTFTTATWNTEQAVIVTAATDNDSTNDSVRLSHMAVGGDYNGVRGSVAVTVNDDDGPQVSITMCTSCVTPSTWAGWSWLRGMAAGAANRKVRALSVRAVSTLEGSDNLSWADVRATMTSPRWVEGPTEQWQALRRELNRLEGCRSGRVAVSEGMAASFTLKASPAPTTPLTVSVLVTQSGDYAAADATGAKTVTIPVTGTISFTVATVNDNSAEANGSIAVTVSPGSGYRVVSGGSARVAVLDDDTLLISVADATVKEAEGAELAFRVWLNQARTTTVKVKYATRNGTATAGEDYVAAAGRLSFAPGETEKTITVAILDDSHD